MKPLDANGKPLKVRRFKKETRYVHKRSDGLTTRRNNGGTRSVDRNENDPRWV